MTISVTGMHVRTGRHLSGVDHIRQSLTDLLTTPIGSRVMRRSYGSLIPTLIDQPMNGTTVLRLYAATASAIQLWEPRIQLNSVQLERGDDGQLRLVLDGVVNAKPVEMTIGVRP